MSSSGILVAVAFLPCTYPYSASGGLIEVNNEGLQLVSSPSHLESLVNALASTSPLESFLKRVLMIVRLAARSESPPAPSSTLPFAHDNDFVDRGNLLEQIREQCSVPASRTALVGLVGDGSVLFKFDMS